MGLCAKQEARDARARRGYALRMRVSRVFSLLLSSACSSAFLFGACSYDEPSMFGGGSMQEGGTLPPKDGPVSDVPTLPPREIPGNAPAHCRDFEKSADESDVDCGGDECAPCGPTQVCIRNEDCFSAICTDGHCAQAELDDNVKNGVESDVDCGGEAYAPKCADDKRCKRDADCASAVCRGGRCQAPSATDGVKNGSESDVDCGGLNGAVPRCAPGKTCTSVGDCEGDAAGCNNIDVSTQMSVKVCAPASAANNLLDNGETATDCGGPDPLTPRCGRNKSCLEGSDCYSGVCSNAKICQPPTGVDGVQNGDESDKDCGNATTGAGKCDPGQRCRTRLDCKEGACGLDGRCTSDASCAQHHGGDTCGAGESVGDGGVATHESCCAEVALPSGAIVDKYLITAGRMRSMIDTLDGNVDGFIRSKPPSWWRSEWTAELPTIRAVADFRLGPWNYSEGCHLRYGGARTYDTDTDFQYGNGTVDQSVVSRDELDEKALNCVPMAMAAALCAFDGKKLASFTVLDEARKLGGAFPWGNEPPNAERINHDFGDGPTYVFPLGATELSAHISAPGRRPGGNTPAGHADIVGNLLPWILDPNPALHIVSSYSWTVDEGQGEALGYPNHAASYVIGARCMR